MNASAREQRIRPEILVLVVLLSLPVGVLARSLLFGKFSSFVWKLGIGHGAMGADLVASGVLEGRSREEVYALLGKGDVVDAFRYETGPVPCTEGEGETHEPCLTLELEDGAVARSRLSLETLDCHVDRRALPFDAERWREGDAVERQYMARELVRTDALSGLSKRELLARLG